MKTKIFTILGLIIVLIVSGCVSEQSALDQVFSKGGISFNYPSDWTNLETTGDIVSGGSDVEDLGSIGTDSIQLDITKANLSDNSASIESLKEATILNLKSGSDFKLLSDTKTTIDGLTAYESIYTVQDPTSGDLYKGSYLIIGQSGKNIYYLDFFTLESDFESNYPIFQDIMKTIKIS